MCLIWYVLDLRRVYVSVCMCVYVCLCVSYHSLGTRNSAGILSSYACTAPVDPVAGPGGGGSHMDRAAVCNNDKNSVFLARSRPGLTLREDSDRARQRRSWWNMKISTGRSARNKVVRAKEWSGR